MPTDPTPQAVTCKCGVAIGKLWNRVGTCEVRVGNHWHEPAEPSPALPAERVIEVAPQRCKHGVWKADLCYDCEREATACPAPAEERIRSLEAALTTVREERDRAQAALRDLLKEAEVFAKVLPAYPQSEPLKVARAALKPVSDRQPEGRDQVSEHDEWQRPIVYVAEYTSSTFGGGKCVFTNLEAAIFYVVSLLDEVDWSTFPDNATRKYPDEERNGQEEHHLTPAFVLDRIGDNGKPIKATIWRTATASDWTVGNGIAHSAKTRYRLATGHDDVFLHGKGDKLHANLTRREHSGQPEGQPSRRARKRVSGELVNRLRRQLAT